MSKALEAAARAIAAHDGMEDEPGWWHIEYARSAIAAMEAEGFVMVPVEPTQAMVEAGDIGLATAGVDDSTPEDADWCYRAMITARPRAA